MTRACFSLTLGTHPCGFNVSGKACGNLHGLEGRKVGLFQSSNSHTVRAFANMPLGLFSETTYDQKQLHLRAGDRLFVHTDGLTEALSPYGQEFGEDRLRTVLAEAGDETVLEIKKRVGRPIGRRSSSYRGHAGSRSR